MFGIKVLLDISQNSQENTCVRSLFLVADPRPATLLKTLLWRSCFSGNFGKFLKTPFHTEHLRWLLLELEEKCQNYKALTQLILRLEYEMSTSVS